MLQLEFAFELRAEVDKPIEFGRRRIVPIRSGTFEGMGIRARVLPGGADRQLIHEDGLTELEARYELETDKGDLISVNNRGIRHGPPEVIRKLNAGESVDQSLIYFRTVPWFEAAAPELQWLTRSIFVGAGERYPSEVVIRFYRVF